MSGPVAFVQCALLYTNSNGERRIRVHTMCLPVTAELSEMYRAADGGACAALLAKLAVEKALMSRLEETRQALQVCQGGCVEGGGRQVGWGTGHVRAVDVRLL